MLVSVSTIDSIVLSWARCKVGQLSFLVFTEALAMVVVLMPRVPANVNDTMQSLRWRP